jgi:hypothetical protein
MLCRRARLASMMDVRLCSSCKKLPRRGMGAAPSVGGGRWTLLAIDAVCGPPGRSAPVRAAYWPARSALPAVEDRAPVAWGVNRGDELEPAPPLLALSTSA